MRPAGASRRSRFAILTAALLAGLLTWGAGSASSSSAGAAGQELFTPAQVARSIDRELNDRWDPISARKLLETIGRAAFNPVQYDYYDSRVAFYEGNYPRALELVKKALETGGQIVAASGGAQSPGVDPEQMKAHEQFVEATIRATQGFRFRESGRFIVGYAPGRDELIVDETIRTLESQYDALNKAIGTSFENKIRVEILPTGSAFVDASGIPRNAIETTNTIALCKYNKLLFTSPGATARGYDWRDTAAHELTHMFVFRRTNNGAPVWFQEGSAKYLENLWRGTRGGMSASQETLFAGALKKNKLIPIARMHPSFAYLDSNRDSALAFTQVALILEYIVEDMGKGGYDVLNRIYDSMAKGAPYEQAIEYGVGKPFAAFFDDWLEYARRRPLRIVSSAHVAQVRLVDPGQKIDAEEEDEEPGVDVPREAKNFVRLGDLLRARQHFLAARIEYSKALSRAPHSPVFISKFAAASVAAGVTDGVHDRLSKALEIYPEYVTLYQRLGDYHFSREEWGEAENAYLRALDFNPFHMPVRIRLVQIYDRLKKTDERDRHVQALRLIESS